MAEVRLLQRNSRNVSVTVVGEQLLRTLEPALADIGVPFFIISFYSMPHLDHSDLSNAGPCGTLLLIFWRNRHRNTLVRDD
jgi:hypothetical protein